MHHIVHYSRRDKKKLKVKGKEIEVKRNEIKYVYDIKEEDDFYERIPLDSFRHYNKRC